MDSKSDEALAIINNKDTVSFYTDKIMDRATLLKEAIRNAIIILLPIGLYLRD